MRNNHPTPVYYILLPKTGQWAGHYNPVVEDQYYGKGKDSLFDLGMYSHPEGANRAIRIFQGIWEKRRKRYQK